MYPFPKPARNPNVKPGTLFKLGPPKDDEQEPDLSGFTPDQNPEEQDLSGFTPDGPNTPIPYTGSPNRQPVKGPEDRTALEDFWNELNRPHIDFSPYAKALADKIPGKNTSNPHLGYARGLIEGGIEGVGNLLSGLTSDLGLATAAIPEGRIAKYAPEAAAVLGNLRRGASLPFAAHGGYEALRPDATLQQRAQGVFEAAGGAAGFLHKPVYTKVLDNIRQPTTESPVAPNYNQPDLDFNLPDFHQPSLFDEKYPSNKPPIQQQLTEATPVPYKEPEQSKFNLDFQPPNLSSKFRNEFQQPEVTNESKPFYGTPETPVSAKNFVDNLPESPDKHGVMMTKESPFPKADDRLLDEVIRNKQVNYSNPRLEDIPMDKLNGTQDSVNPEIVHDYIEQGDRARMNEVPEGAKGKMEADTPTAIKIGDEYYLAGGHHRATADLARGKDTFQGVVYDADVPPELAEKLKASLERDRMRRDSMDLEPKEMRAKDNPNNVAMGGADPRVLDILGTTLYSKDRPLVAVKELLQNAIDEHRISKTNAPIKVLFGRNEVNPRTNTNSNTVTVRDQGRGLKPDQIYTVLTDVGKSGKLEEEGASGGFGFAKASPMLGGEYSRFESIVNEGGQKVRYSFEGTPAELKNQQKGVPLNREIVHPNTPTGFLAKVYYPENQDFYYASRQAEHMGQRSFGSTSPIEVADVDNSNRTPEEFNNYLHNQGKSGIAQHYVDTHHPEVAPPLVDTIKMPGADIDIHYEVPPGSKAQEYRLDVLNNGMYQFGKRDNYGNMGAIKGVPSNIKVNVRPKVEEGLEGYPFSTNREQLNSKVDDAVQQWIKDNLVSGALKKQIQSLRDMYTSMTPLAGPGVKPKVIFDPGNLLTPEEMDKFVNSPFITHFSTLVDHIVGKVLESTGQQGWTDRLEKTGISLDPSHHGIHIPNPDNGAKSTILINPFNFIRNVNDPMEAAYENTATILHEVGHIGDWKNTSPSLPNKIDWSNADTDSPELGNYFKAWINETKHSHNVGDANHGLDFLNRVGHIYSQYGAANFLQKAEVMHGLFTDKSTGNFTPEIQELLRLYTEREGRIGDEENILSRTGQQSEATGSGKEGNVSNVGPSGKRPIRPVQLGKKLTSEFNKPIQPKYEAATPEVVNQIQKEVPQTEIPKRMSNIVKHTDKLEGVSKDEKENLIEKALNFNRTLLTSYDVSGPGRQGLPLIGRKEWWTSLDDMFKAWGSEKAYNNIMESIKQDPTGYFQPNEKGMSFANEAGLDLTDALSHREEIFRSRWAEDYMPGVRPSVRAYTAFLNKLRADSFKNMVQASGAESNLKDARAIADFINVATGRGRLGAFEPAAKPLAQIFFSPRLTASRLQMYTRTFNPKYYANVPPVVRQNQLRSAIATAGVGMLIGQLSKLAGASVNSDPTNSDFGKIRFGRTRIDPFAGHQQFLVAAARLASGRSTSSTTGKTTDMNHPKYGQTTRADVFSRFLENKLAPVPSFVWSWMQGKEFDGTPFNVKKELLNRTVPIVMQDLYDIWNEDPTLLQGGLASASAIGGFGVQTYGR